MIDLGKVAYNAYAKAVKTTWDNKSMPTWEQLGDRQRAGWDAAAQAVLAV